MKRSGAKPYVDKHSSGGNDIMDDNGDDVSPLKSNSMPNPMAVWNAPASTGELPLFSTAFTAPDLLSA